MVDIFFYYEIHEKDVDLMFSFVIIISQMSSSIVVDVTFTEVNDTVKELAFHTFDYPNTDDYVQLVFSPSLGGMWFEVFLKFNNTPNINDFEFNTTVPEDLSAEMSSDQEEYLRQLENYTDPYVLVIPKSYTNKTGPYTAGVLIHGKS